MIEAAAFAYVTKLVVTSHLTRVTGMSYGYASALLIAAAFLCWGLWLGEVVWVKGWDSLAWLDFNWSALPICAVIVVTSSYVVSPDAGWRGRTTFVVFAFALTTGAFVAGREALIDLFSVWVVPYYQPLVTLAAAGLAVSAGLTMAARWCLAPVHVWTTAVVIAALVLVLPLSFMTVMVFPALNGSTNDIHAVKMGYPVLWTALLVPLALRLGRRRRRFGAPDTG
jgi:hypothetical protein